MTACPRKPDGFDTALPDTDTESDGDSDADSDGDSDTDTDSDTDPIDTASPDFSLVINEFLANPDGADANCDGVQDNADDEFIEIVNAGGIPIDLSGATLSDTTGAKHTFPSGSVL